TASPDAGPLPGSRGRTETRLKHQIQPLAEPRVRAGARKFRALGETSTLHAPAAAGPEQGEAARYGRYLLIDSQGLPYTVLVEEAGAAGERAGLRKVYCCPVCSRTFEYLSYLQRHSITHSEHKPHVCRACGKAFKRTSHLERHKYTHAGRKPHQCPICQRSFRDAGELAHHQRVHTGERPFQCEDCHMRFGERNTLQRHIRRKHRQQPEIGCPPVPLSQRDTGGGAKDLARDSGGDAKGLALTWVPLGSSAKGPRPDFLANGVCPAAVGLAESAGSSQSPPGPRSALGHPTLGGPPLEAPWQCGVADPHNASG
uniref:Zinc finger protein 581 n=1 Tax=Chrysemys picta bellii TaxID=8478 RepID=A0A8C3FAD2_CHRPI